MHRRTNLLAALAVAAIVGSACSSAASTAAPTSAAPAATATPAPSTAATPAASLAASASAATAPGAFQLDLPPGKGDVLVDVAKYSKPGPYRVCFSNGFSGNSWRAMMLQSLKNYADKHKDLIKDLIIVDGQGDVNKQVSDIESCIAQKVDAIMLIANSGTAVAPVMKKAMDAGIVVVPFNLMVEGKDYTAYNGTDDCQRGTLAGKWLVQKLGPTGGGIIALGGIPGNSSTAAAWECTQKEFVGTQVKVLAYKDANWQEDNAKVVCTDLLTAQPQIDAVWSDGGQDTTGCLKAFVAANRALVPSTGDDYNGLFKLYLANKASNPKFDIFTLSQPTYESKLALNQILAILSGNKEVYKTWLFAGGEITGANAAEKVKADLPDSVFVDNDLTDEQLKQIFAGQ